MGHRLQTKEGKKFYALRKQTSGSVFGIIKSVFGILHFLLRGFDPRVNPPSRARSPVGMQVRGEYGQHLPPRCVDPRCATADGLRYRGVADVAHGLTPAVGLPAETHGCGRETINRQVNRVI